jgi:hypothetical protein
MEILNGMDMQAFRFVLDNPLHFPVSQAAEVVAF